MHRRTFIKLSAVTLAAGWTSSQAAAAPSVDLHDQIGITTGSFVKHLTALPQPGKLRLLDLPRIMRDELDMRVIDLMTATLASTRPDYLDALRAAADKAGCILTNLKMNLKDLVLDSPDEAVRRNAIDQYKATIDAAARLGVRWVRPLPGDKRPDMPRYVASLHELMDYAATSKIQVLVENNGWMRDDPEAIPEQIKAVGKGLACSPDTGNWTDKARYEGLAKAFPHAVTCDFKFLELGPGGEHKAYDLKRCFDIAWQAGFRGPWCFEHFHAELAVLLREMAAMRDQLRKWIAAAKA